MQMGLVNLKVPECLTCVALLENAGFDMEKLEGMISEIQNEGVGISPFTKMKRRLAESNVEMGQIALPLQDAPGEQQERPETEKDAQHEGEGDEGSDAEQPLDQRVKDFIALMKCLEVLPPGTDGKLRPVVCRACRSKKQPNGRVFDLTSQSKQAIAFITKHCKSWEHRQKLPQWIASRAGENAEGKASPCQQEEEPKKDQGEDRQFQACQGFPMNQSHGPYAQFREEIRLWAINTNLASSLSKHSYNWDLGTQNLVVFHEKCLKVADPACQKTGNLAMCNKCALVDKHKNILRNAIRFAVKHWMARLLEARLFHNDGRQAQLLEELKSTGLFITNKKRFEELLEQTDEDLQSWVRKSFAKQPHYLTTPNMENFLDRVVKPCLSVNIQDCNPELRQLTSGFSSTLVNGNLSDFSELCAKIALACCQGKFAQRPPVMGILCQCLDAVDRESRGVFSMKKRRALSNTELDLVSEAGSMLALNNCSESMMSAFGFNRESCLRAHGKVDNLHEAGLPCPALALLWPDVMDTNVTYLDSLIKRAPNSRTRRLAVCMDFTYLLKLHAVMKLHQQKVVIGAPFCMKDLQPDETGYRSCLAEVPADTRVTYKGEKQKANRMLLGCSIQLSNAFTC